MPAQTELPKTVRNDIKVAKLLADGWVRHANYDPTKPGDLESAMLTSVSPFVQPSNAREVLIIDTAYGMDGSLQPGLKAIYMRDFKQPEERHEFGRSLNYRKFA